MAGGEIFNYRGSWCADGERTSWESAWRIVGERGALTWDGFDNIRAAVRTDERDGILEKQRLLEVPPLNVSDRIGGHLGVIQDFVAAVQNGTEPETAGADNIKSLAMVFSAIESAEAGRRIAIEP
jgi:predicted dehydrogenase